MNAGVVSFTVKKTDSKKSTQKNTSSEHTTKQHVSKHSLSTFFEQQSKTFNDDSIKSKSFISGWDARGFNEVDRVDYDSRKLIIKCKNILEKPERRSEQVKSKIINPTLSHSSKNRNAKSTQKYGLNEVQKKGNHALKASDDSNESSLDESEDIDKVISRDIDKLLEKSRHKQNEFQTHSKKRQPLLAIANPKLYQLRQENKKDDLELFKKEVTRLPEFTFSSFDNVPVESFGLAMLRGMGYDPKIHKSQPIDLKKRLYQRAGLGADSAFERTTTEKGTAVSNA